MIHVTWCCLEFRDKQDVLCLKSLRHTVEKRILICFILFSGYVPGAGELISQITPKRSKYAFFLRGSKVFRIQLPSLWYQNGVCATLLSKVIFFQYIEMGVARRASSGFRIFFARP